MAIIPSQAGKSTLWQGIPAQGDSPQHSSSQARSAKANFSQNIAEQSTPPCPHESVALPPGRVSVLALSAGFRLLCMLPLLLAVWLAVAWALAD